MKAPCFNAEMVFTFHKHLFSDSEKSIPHAETSIQSPR